jgi:hypothetical protein
MERCTLIAYGLSTDAIMLTDIEIAQRATLRPIVELF